jgi:PPE-repeat protein
MPDPRWTGPPEVVALIFETGPGPVSVIANNTVWVTETASHEMAMGLSFVNTAATAANWQGMGGIASMVAATGLNAGLQTLVGWTAHKIAVTQAAVDAFTTARSSVIPSVVSQTNRDEWATLNATNILGQNTPAIIERDTEYFGEHWPHNSSVGWAYSGALSALSAALAVPPPVAPIGATPAASAAAGDAASQAAANTTTGSLTQASGQAAQTAGQTASSSSGDTASQLSSLMQQPLQMVSGATEPLKEAAQAPMQAFQGVTSLPQTFLQAMGGMFPSSSAAPDAAAAEAVAEPLVAGGGTAGGIGAGSVGAFPGAGLTSFTRPTSSFEPETGGRPTGLGAGVLNAAEVRGPTTSGGMGGTPMPISPAGMLARGSGGESEKEAVTHARIVVHGDPTEPR